MLSSLKVKIILTEFDTEKVVKLAQASYFIILQRGVQTSLSLSNSI
ncbi:hypothetical protein [Sulfuracidifex tepidarius]|uniref:Uncharacterized protein n=1 Tax=Sulfuracidifex tepidarius TaxID=1294262 RepID=A0A510E0H8_9CREN|nr:hypothetical protein [Sulfuracidifex tepidarius]BBG25608.1 hypothetical protein IC007_0113 [Sulfuracidifex tepidarius]